MGKPNCSFARYAEQFAQAGAPSDAAPSPMEAGEPRRDEQVVGVRRGVRMVRSAGEAAEIASDVAAARAAKAPAGEARRKGTSSTPSPRRGGCTRPPSGGDASRKRTSRESAAVEPSASEGLGLGPKGADFRFSYSYPNKDLAFTLDNVACSDLASNIPGGFTPLPSPDSLSEASLYSSWAQEEFKSIGAGNRLVDAYERRLKKAGKAESAAQASLAKERKNSDLYRKESASELKSLKEKFDTETARLRASRDSRAKAEKGYRVYADRLRRHILSQEAAKRDLELLGQVTGMKECLEDLRRTGVAIPEETMKRLADDKAKYYDLVNQFEIVDLLDGDLEERMTAEPTRATTDGTAGPSRAAADGDDRAPADL